MNKPASRPINSVNALDNPYSVDAALLANKTG